MKKTQHFSCYLIGEGSLLLQCAEILSLRGHKVLGILSKDRAVRRWAAGQVPCFDSLTDLETEMAADPPDYLFSIVNKHILRGNILTLPRLYAINYHDALLPRYAGTHATSWAIMNGERMHGVTWHIISERVDAGDILKQRVVEVDEDDTAFSLNTKCYEAAIKTFSELVENISSGEVRPLAQHPSDRSFFPRFKRPRRAGVISWDETAAEIGALVRALDFGPQPNPLGTSKLKVANGFVVVKKVDIERAEARRLPGTIVGIGSDSIRVATKTEDVVLREFYTPNGQALTAAGLLHVNNLAEGSLLPPVGQDEASGLEIINSECSRNEEYWEARLASLEPYILPFPAPVRLEGAHGYAIRAMQEVMLAAIENTLDDNPCGRGALPAAAFAAYLYRLGRSDSFDLAVDLMSSRNLGGGAESLFATHLPFHVECDGELTFTEFYHSFLKGLAAIEERRTFSRDITLRYPSLSHPSLQGGLAGLRIVIQVVERLTDYAGTEGGDLILVVSRSDGRCLLAANTSRVTRSGLDKIKEQFSLLLAGAAEDPAALLKDLPIVPAQELAVLLSGWGEVETEWTTGETLHQLFFEQVERTPEATALVYGSESLSYRELGDRSRALAKTLKGAGVGPETLVGLCVDRSPAMIVGILAILAAGGAYVPLDPTYPHDRLSFIVEDTNSPVIVAQERAADKLLGHNSKLLVVDESGRHRGGTAGADVMPVTDRNLAYLIYTSGSTGKPKGVAIEHRSAVTLVRWAHRVFTPEQLSGVLASTSMCFDLSIFEIFVPLTRGGSVILADNALHLLRLEAAEKVTLVNTVPSAMMELIRAQGVPHSVKTVTLAGEPLKTELVNQIYERTSTEQVFDLYGPSEDTTYTTFTLRKAYEPATIGKPITNTQVYIVDPRLQPVPIGVPGEILIGGDGLARGYLNRSELTEEKFIRNPLTTRGERVYRTGDLARFREDGNIEFLGRLDHQVKVRGFRIELGEVEAVLLRHPGVAEAVLVAKPDPAGVDQLVAYVSHKPGEVPTTLDLRDFLKAQLPQYMLPSVFVIIDALPQTQNGKIDRRALPDPEFERRAQGDGYVAFRDEIEKQLVGIWEEVLGFSPIGVRDSFFDLGGHSLQAVRLFSQIKNEFDKELPLATLFTLPTVEKLASLIRGEVAESEGSCMVPIQSQGEKRPFFCMHARGGNVLFYRDLAKHLGADRPFYGLQAQGLDGKRPRHKSLEEMAAHYISEVKMVQPSGPYLLGGSSFGGIIAYEMAQQLTRAGERVALLAMFDTTGPGYFKFLPSYTGLHRKVANLVQRFNYLRSALGMLRGNERKIFLQLKMRKLKVNWKRAFRKRVISVGMKLPGSFRKMLMPDYVGKPWALIENEKNIAQILANYETRPYSGQITLFRASKQPVGIQPDSTLGWSEYAHGELVTHEIPGYHGTIVVEPHVRLLAIKLSECLEQSDGQIEQAIDGRDITCPQNAGMAA